MNRRTFMAAVAAASALAASPEVTAAELPRADRHKLHVWLRSWHIILLKLKAKYPGLSYRLNGGKPFWRSDRFVGWEVELSYEGRTVRHGLTFYEFLKYQDYPRLLDNGEHRIVHVVDQVLLSGKSPDFDPVYTTYLNDHDHTPWLAAYPPLEDWLYPSTHNSRTLTGKPPIVQTPGLRR